MLWLACFLGCIIAATGAVFDSTTALCADTTLSIKTRTGCVFVTIGDEAFYLKPSLYENSFTVWKAHSSLTFNARLHTDDVVINNHQLRVPIVVSDNTQRSECDGLLPLGVLSPLWQCWNVAVIEPARVRLLIDPCTDYFVNASSKWDVGAVSFQMAPLQQQENESQTSNQAMLVMPPHPSLKKHVIVFAFPWLTRQLAENSAFPTLQYLSKRKLGAEKTYVFALDTHDEGMISYWPPAIHLSNETTISYYQGAGGVFGVMLHGATGELRLLPLPFAENGDLNLWFNGAAWLVLLVALLIFTLIRSVAGVQLNGWTVSPMGPTLDDTSKALLIHVGYWRHGVAVCLFIGFCASNSIGLFWEEQTCLLTHMCLPVDTALIFAMLFGLAGWGVLIVGLRPLLVSNRNADAIFDMQWFHVYCMVVIGLTVSSIPFMTEDRFAALHTAVTLVGLSLVNFEFMLVSYWISTHDAKYLQLVAAWYMGCGLCVNSVVVIIQLQPTFVHYMSHFGIAILWSVVFWLIAGVLLPLVCLVHNVASSRKIRKIK